MTKIKIKNTDVIVIQEKLIPYGAYSGTTGPGLCPWSGYFDVLLNKKYFK